MVTVVECEIESNFRGAKAVAHAGVTVNAPANAPHALTGASNRPARLLCMCSPPGQEEYFAPIGVPVGTRATTPPKLDDAAHAAFIKKAVALSPQYRRELLRH